MSIPTVFISYSHLDEPWKDRLVKHLGIAEKQGLLQTWNDRNLLGGDDWFAEIINAIERGSIAVLLVSHNSLTSGFILNEEVPRMLAQHKLQASRFYPIVVEYCDWEAVEWLKRFNLRPRDGRPVGINKKSERTEEQINYDLTEIAKEIRLAPPLPVPPPAPEPLAGECPYLGLEAFTEDKKHLFFGRDDFAEALFAKVKRQNFVALIGPSGCGKSSVVQAGLFPHLRRDTQAWLTSFFQPQENPFLSLAAEFIKHWQPQAFSSAFINQAVKLATELQDAQRLIEAIHRTVAAPGARLLLVVDQFEELFTLCDESDRRAFLDVLLAAKDAAPVTILLTLRADFMWQAQSFSPIFSQLLDESIVSHRPLTRADLEAAITSPAHYAGLEFEPGLVNSILQEVAAHPDSLPLLEYALKEMWRKRESRVIGHALYEAVGKVEGAISHHADAVLQALPEDGQRMALRALTRLVHVAGEEGEADTRLRLPLSELSEADRAVLQSFVTARLLVTKREEGADAETVEVVHEALIRRWEKLREALDSDREFLMWRRRLASRRKLWEQKERDDKWLLYGGERDDAQRWLNERGLELTAYEIDFITWTERAEYQIEKILPQAPDLVSVSFVPINGEEGCRNWFLTLTLCRGADEALQTAREIADDNARANAMLAISTILIKKGHVNSARQPTVEALHAVSKVKRTNDLVRSLSFINKVATKVGLANEAMQVAREIEDEYASAQALTNLVEPLVKDSQAEMLLRESCRFKDAEAQVTLLSSIVRALVKTGQTDEARQVTMDALNAVCKIESANGQAYAFSTLAESLADGQMWELFQRMIDEALRAIGKIEEKSSSVFSLSRIAQALITSHQKSQAGSVAKEALRIVQGIEDSFTRSSSTTYIIPILVRLGLKDEGLQVAREIKSVLHSCSVQKDLAEALIKMGQVDEALNVVNEIDHARIRSLALCTIAQVLAESGKIVESVSVARKVGEAEERATTLAFIAEAVAKAGQPEEALQISNGIEGWYQRINAQIAAAKAWLDSNCVKEAKEIIDEVRATIGKINIEIYRSMSYGRLASLLARLNSYRESREIADQCSRAADRLVAYTAIFREYHIERDPSLARLFAEEKEEEEDN
jgi:tetratricopeptide (TPR) repeat protein